MQEKAYDKIQYSFMMKTPLQVCTEGTYCNIKAIYDKLTANGILNVEKLKVLPLRSKTRQGFQISQFYLI